MSTIPGKLKAPLPSPLPRLMTCTLVDDPFDDPNWIFEPKLDGLRVWCRRDGKGKVLLVSRNDKPQNLQFPDVAEAVEMALDRPAVLDGEIVCLDEDGRSSFKALQQRFHLESKAEIEKRVAQYPAYFFVFDLLYVDRYDITSLPLSERKSLLRKAVKWSKRIRFTEGTKAKGVPLFNAACKRGDEGIVGKKLSSVYIDGRSPEWVKIKCVGRQEFVIGGWTDPQRTRVGLGALLVGYFSEDAKQFIYAGKVGTGFTNKTLIDLRSRLEKLHTPTNPFDVGKPPKGEHVHWVKPTLVGEFGFAEWTRHGLLRQPRFEGLRMDKNAKQVKRELPKSARAVKRKANADAPPTSAKGKRSTSKALPSTGRVQFSSVDKVFFPEKGFTKGDVIQFYLQIADILLPHLRDRPVTLERLPEGVGGNVRFWQKNTPSHYPAWIKRFELPTEKGKPVQYAVVNDVETLAYLVNQGTVTLHTYLSRMRKLDDPDFVLFDLDPSGRPFSDVVKVAKTLGKLLEKHRVKAYPKTSGKSGIHVLACWGKPGGYDAARAWAMDVAEELAGQLKDIATTARLKASRRGRLYIDVVQNALGHHVVPPCVLRATPSATVSTPLDWDELTARLDPKKFDLRTVLPRIAKKGDLLAPILPRSSTA